MKKKQKFTSDQIKNMSPEELEKLGIGDTLKSLAEKGTKFDYELKFKKAEDIEKKLNTKTFSEGDIVDAVHDANLIADINESIKLIYPKHLSYLKSKNPELDESKAKSIAYDETIKMVNRMVKNHNLKFSHEKKRLKKPIVICKMCDYYSYYNAAIVTLAETEDGGARTVQWDKENKCWVPSNLTVSDVMCSPPAYTGQLKELGIID